MAEKLKFGRYDYAAFLCFISYAMCSIIIPVSLVPIAKDLHFPLTEGGMGLGGILQIGRAIPMVVALILCGFFSGSWGKCRSLGFAMLSMALGVLLAAFSPVYGVMFFALMIAGFGEGIIEGLATPFVQDLHEKEPGRYINFSHSFWSVGVVSVVLVAGALLANGVNWRYIVCGCGVIGLFPAILLLFPSRKHPYPECGEIKKWTAVCGDFWKIVRIPRFWLFFAAMFFAGGGEFCLTFWCASFIQVEYAASAWAAGIGTACFAGGMIVGRMGGGILIRQKKLKEFLVYTALAATVISLFFPFLESLTMLFILLFFTGIATGPFWPSVQSYCSTRMTVDNTMLFILLSAAGIPGCGFFTAAMGILGDTYGLRLSFFLVPFCFIVLAALIGIDWYRSHAGIVKRAKRMQTVRH